MSISNEITRLQTAKSDLKSAIENKGVTVPSATKLDGYASLVEDIETITVDPISITSNGTYSASSGHAYSPVNVNVPSIVPTGSQTFTENGTYDVTALAEAVINVEGGGGVSNVVSGEFTVQSEPGLQEITIPYTGNGYPVAALIYIKGGIYNNNNPYNPDWYNLIQRYVVGMWSMTKNETNTVPNGFNNSKSKASVTWLYKSSTTSATSYSGGANVSYLTFTQGNAESTFPGCVRIRPDGKSISINATNGAGFKCEYIYTYHIIYST